MSNNKIRYQKIRIVITFFKAWGDKSVIYGSIQKERCYK